MSEFIGISVFTHLGTFHIQAATLFARLSAEAQEGWHLLENDAQQARIADHRAFVIASIFSAAAFTEASVNDLFATAAIKPEILQRGGLSGGVVNAIAESWTPRFERQPTIMKYNEALTIAGRSEFDAEPVLAEFTDVIQLRNSLTHYKPEIIETVPPGDPTDLEEMLRSKNFALNNAILRGNANPYFPDHCLSHGCAKWATESCLALVDEFYNRMRIQPPYEHVRHRLGCDLLSR